MREVTSAVANKLLKKYNEDLERLYKSEAACSIYTEIEGVEPIVPEYDFELARVNIRRLMSAISELKHAINVFNTTTTLPNSGFTIDEALVQMALLTKEKNRLDSLIRPTTKEVKTGFSVRSNQIEYSVVNYDIDTVKKKYDAISKELTDLQLELDVVNTTVKFEVAEEI